MWVLRINRNATCWSQRLGILDERARKKMRSAFHRNSRNNQSSSEGGSALTITSLDQLNTYRPQVAPEVIQARNCPTRQCALFTFLTIDPTGNWRIIATPLQCPDHASHPNIYDEPENIPGISYSRARMRRQLRNRLLSSITSGPDPISTTSDSTPAHSYTNESLEMLLLELDDDKSAKTNKSKKARRKERQRQKLLSNGGGSAEAETASETSVLVSPESEIEGKDNAVWTAGSSPESPNSRCCSDPSELDSSSMSSNGDEIIQIDVRISDYRKGKKVNQVTVLNSSSRHANAGNNWWTKETIGKENNHSVWQQVRKQVKDENVSSADEAKEDKEKSPSKGTEESKKEHSLGPKKGGSAADVDLKERSDIGDVPEENSVSMSPRVRSEAEPVQELHVCTNESLQDQDGGNPEDDVKQKSTQKGLPIGNIANLEEELEANSIVEIALPSSVGHNAEMSVDTMDESVQAQTKPLQTPNSGSKLKIGKEVVPFFPSKVQRHPFEALFSSDKIMQAVHNACLMQLESESVHTMTGSPVAEFENLLYACCPEIAWSSDGGLSLDLTLNRLWQWYEQPGCFGVEVKSLDYTNTSTLINNFQFRAYFVPYLSAVQLFRNRKQQPFMMPQSWNPTKEIADDVELLFEFFESAPPPQRRPFYEKIQELIRRGGPGAYGDHTKLGSVNFQDLDPRSWYSVAWYPIYRIPDGNFRAAFLTYHSLSNLVHRPCSQYISNGVVDSCIVSPPVGLHSYNAQGECWFQMSPCLWNHASGFHFPGFDPSRILMDRLRTLEEVACVMSRAVVNKGNGRCENRHHDYEFFVARNGY